MKNKWIWITLTVIGVLIVLIGVAFIFHRIGFMYPAWGTRTPHGAHAG
jgi:TRAP-type mannitol/chloroaromatic compound transport system permease small subunit